MEITEQKYLKKNELSTNADQKYGIIINVIIEII